MRQSVLLGSVGEKAEVTDAHEAGGQHMEEEAARADCLADLVKE